MRALADPDCLELKRILNELLAADITISGREVVRRHSSLKHPSQINRNETRSKLVEEYVKLQSAARAQRAEKAQGGEGVQSAEGGGGTAASGATGAALRRQLAERNDEITALKKQKEALATSYAECIRAVKESGGIEGLVHFWSRYKNIAETVRAAGAAAPKAQLHELPSKSSP